ncbi:MAG: hypothetical protein ACRD28_00345 [Acidobacteriaceae bacterium]
MNAISVARRVIAVLLFLAIAGTAWLLWHQALREVGSDSRHNLTLNPGYQHSQRLKVAAARAAMDVLGMAGTEKQDAGSISGYQADYRLQKMQIQADSEGLERWCAQDGRRRGLLLEIRASLSVLNAALDQATGAPADASGLGKVPLLPALNRTERALSNYAASLTEPTRLQGTQNPVASPVELWWLLVLLLVELAVLAGVVFTARNGLSS